MLLILAVFFLLALVILFCGSRLSKYGDIIAEKTNMGGSWIGVILLATITSLPELINSLSSVVIVNVPALALGDIFGSCVFNLLILALLDLFQRGVPLSSTAYYGNILSAAFGILLIGIVLYFYMLKHLNLSLFWIGLDSIIIIVVYLVSIRLIFLHSRREYAKYFDKSIKILKYDNISLQSAIKKYTVNAIFVVIAASILPYVGDRLAIESGLGQSFVGNVFVGLVTSLPELVVSISAIRINAVDMAMGNILGSNIFNLFIYAVADIFYLRSNLVSHILMGHIISIISAILMTAIVIVAIVFRAEKKKLFISIDALLIFVIYVITLILQYINR